MAQQSLPNNVHTHVQSFDLTNNVCDTQSKSFNWLTGAAMTQKNVEKLSQMTNNILLGDKSGASASIFIHERAPR